MVQPCAGWLRRGLSDLLRLVLYTEALSISHRAEQWINGRFR
jgi:hypothetical protein